MGKRNKKHWAANTDDPSGGRKFRLACGMWAWIDSSKESGPLWFLCGAAVYRDLASCDPDWYCSDCATKARLALAKESAPKPSEVVWPKPRPIEEYTGNGPFLGLCKHHGWLTVRPERSKLGNRLHGWLTCGPSAVYVIPTHFLPLPPEVR